MYIGNSWDAELLDEFGSEYMNVIRRFLDTEYAERAVYPPRERIFSAFKYTPFENVRVVILGQDPYIRKGQAHGLALSVPPGVEAPPSLKNIYKELYLDLGIEPANHGCLIEWAKQGVLLLNTVLTVREGASNSHAGHGWERFTDAVIKRLGELSRPLVFILWGRPAQTKEKLISGNGHLILKAPHPSPLSASGGFFGSRPFSKTNDFLAKNGQTPIDWRLPDVNVYARKN